MDVTFAAENLSFEKKNLNLNSILSLDDNYNLKYIPRA